MKKLLLEIKVLTIITSRLILRKGFPSSITDFSLFMLPIQ